MASTRSSRRVDRAGGSGPPDIPAPDAGTAASSASAGDGVAAALHAALTPLAAAHHAAAGGRPLRVVIALSGGRDSMALLDAFARLARELPIVVSALHVHHGLSPNADAWAAFCAAECENRAIALAIRRVRIERVPGESPEAAARGARYAALSSADADVVALAHHADDQAETLLLQLLRGAGPLGLAAMPTVRVAGGPAVIRPFLALPRAAIETYARQCGVAWIDDESNADRGIRRNYLRHEIAPRLATAFPGYPATLVRAAAHNAEAAGLLDELAALDAGKMVAGDASGAPTLDRAALIALAQRAPPRARNLLRWFIRRNALPLPSTARLAAMLDQLVRAAPDARVRLSHAGAELGIFRGRIVVHAPPVARFAMAWSGQPALALPHGVLEFTPARGEGLAVSALAATAVTVRRREGGERIRVAADRPSRALKRLLHDAGIAPWQRDSLPFVYCDDALAAVPRIGVDAAFRAAGDAPGIVLHWRPAGRA